MKLSPRQWAIAGAVGALALDQASKLVMLYGFHFHNMAPGQAVPVLPFFNLVMVWNRGISYGLFAAHGAWGTALLSLLAVIIVAFLVWWLKHTHRPLVAAAIGLVIGGAVGNLIDRLVYGRVADFFHFYYKSYDWYVFNIADCAITLGVGALLYDALLRPEHGAVPHGQRPGAADAE